MILRIKLLAAVAAVALPAALAAQETAPPTPPPAATQPQTPVPSSGTPPVADTMAHETAERAADAVEADAVSDSQVHAQAETMPPPAATPPAAAAAPAEASAQAQTPAQAAPVGPATQADFAAGAQVRDQAGGVVGTIESADSTGAVVSTGTVRAKLPLASFGRGGQGLIVSVTRAQLEAAVRAQTPAPTPGS